METKFSVLVFIGQRSEMFILLSNENFFIEMICYVKEGQTVLQKFKSDQSIKVSIQPLHSFLMFKLLYLFSILVISRDVHRSSKI
jgi:hypothetical protein